MVVCHTLEDIQYMTKSKLLSLFLTSLCFSIAIALPSTAAMSNSSYSSSENNVMKREAAIRSIWAPDAAEVEADTNKLSALTISSTTTPSSHSFQFTFSTGGQGYADVTSTYLVAPSDDDYQATSAEIDDLDIDGRTALDKRNSLDENFDSIRDFNAYIFSITPTIGKPIILPRKIFRNHLFGLSPSSIGVKAFDFATLTFSNPINPSHDINIYIPDNINNVYADSFINLDTCSSRIHFYVELSEEQVNEQWDADWNHGASVEYNYLYADHTGDVPGLNGHILTRVTEYEYDDKGNIIELEVENVVVPGVFLARGGASLFGDEDANYFLGYSKDGKELPLYLEYGIESSGGLVETRYEPFLLAGRGAVYNSVGAKISGWSTTISIDIKIGENETIDPESLIIHNIYPKLPNSIAPDESVIYYIEPRVVFAKSYDISDFISVSFKGISSFMDYTSVKADITKGSEDIYQELNPSSYRSNETNITSGKSHIRHRITSLSQSQYLIVYGQNSSQQFYVGSPINQYILSSKVNRVSYIFRNSEVDPSFSSPSIRSLDFVGLYVTLDIYGQNGPLARSAISIRFGFVRIMPLSDSPDVFGIDVLLTWMSIGFIVTYLLISTALFFILRERYKNNEFRRMKPRKFWFQSSLGLFGSLIFILFVTFITLRSTLFANAIVVFNPLDPFIIVTMITSVLIVGYFIKFIVVQTKAGNERRKAHKLKLDQDKNEDGTN